MKKVAVYITVRLELASNEELTEESIDNVVSELDYSFNSRTVDVSVADTEITEINEINEL